MRDKVNKIEMKLIDNDYTSSIFVEKDDDAKIAWEKYIEVQEMENGFDKNVALKQARKNLSEYIINIPKKCLPDESNIGIYHLRSDHVPEHYDEVKGFNIDKELPPEQSSAIF
ncbi:MAG: hypothetical protein ISS11_07740 [Candidatus Marinimicrobia bacterium]|nr:hypothetical protein [Candidatus Neomarinimicrobiota bacterium]